MLYIKQQLISIKKILQTYYAPLIYHQKLFPCILYGCEFQSKYATRLNTAMGYSKTPIQSMTATDKKCPGKEDCSPAFTDNL